MSRLTEQISDLQRIETEAITEQAQLQTQIEQVQTTQSNEEADYKRVLAENNAEMTIRQNDLDVFQFILTTTQCEGATSFLQGKKHRVCNMEGGGRSLQFDDQHTQQLYEKKLTSKTKQVISDVLAAVQVGSVPLNQTHPPAVVHKVEVKGEDGPSVEEGMMKNCPPTPPDCGLLHDKLSLMWGDYKDKVDELQMTMNENEQVWTELNSDFNAQIQMLSQSKGRFGQQLAEAQSNLAADRKELGLKQEEVRVLDGEYQRETRSCQKRIEWILYQDMCALIVVRNSVLKNSEVCPGDAIVDCEVDAWIPTECSVSCDDACPGPTPFQCGGWQTINRKIVVAPDACGLNCPAMQKSKKCNQIKCPVHCEMSEWSGFSKCSAECEGGVKLRTRNTLTKPKNGGRACDDVEDSQPCHTGSCDRDCSLAEWTSWSPCSVACGGGFQERIKHVLVPVRGEGKCPKKESKDRFEKQNCNEHDCIGDEICVATQDLLIAVDASGSLTEQGFNVFKVFCNALLAKYEVEYWGQERMRIGLIQFGNGIIMEDGSTVSPAINVHGLSDDIPALSAAVNGMAYKKGFTNMAQAFAMAENMFIAGARKSAQPAVLTITDGKPSFAFQTRELVRQLDDKGVQRFFIVVHEDEGIVFHEL